MPRFLIVAPSWVGDMVMAQPLLMRLLQRHPGSTIDVFAPRWIAQILARMPEAAQVIDNPFGHGELDLRQRWQVARRIKRRGYDQVLVLPNSLKSALVPFFAGIPTRTGFIGEARRGLLNDARSLDKQAYPLMVERFALLAEPRGAPLQRPLPAPRLMPDAAARDAVLRRLGLNLDKPVTAFCPGAEYGPAKRWPVEHFAALARVLAAEGRQVWLLGSAKDAPIGAQIMQLAPGAAIDLTGRTNLAEAGDLLSLASGMVSNDSGLMHVAAALDRPMAALYGSSSPQITPPRAAQARGINLKLRCRPCFKRRCPLRHIQFMRQMTA